MQGLQPTFAKGHAIRVVAASVGGCAIQTDRRAIAWQNPLLVELNQMVIGSRPLVVAAVVGGGGDGDLLQSLLGLQFSILDCVEIPN